MRPLKALGLLIAIACLPLSLTHAQAQDDDPSSIVLPPNPTARPSPSPVQQVDQTDEADQGDDVSPTDDPSAIVLPPNPTIRPQTVVPEAPNVQNAGNDPACQQVLAAAGAIFEPRGRVEGSGQCGIDDAVALQAIGTITLQPAALITCSTANIFTAFVQETIVPQARRTMGSAPSTIYIAASYACRGRNNVPGARISEHGFGRAVDVRALELEDGQTWNVRPRAAGSEEPAARFQAIVREEACGPFNTVLGPGSDGHHTDHLHFDAALRSSSYCR